MRSHILLIAAITISLIILPAVLSKDSPEKFEIAEGVNPQVGVDTSSGKVAVLYRVENGTGWDVYSTVMKNKAKTGIFKTAKSRLLANNVPGSTLPFLSPNSEGGGFLSVWSNAMLPSAPYYTLLPGSASSRLVKLNNGLGKEASPVSYPDASVYPVVAAVDKTLFLVVYGGYGLLDHDLVGLYSATVSATGKIQGSPKKLADGAYGTYSGGNANLLGTWQFGFEPTDIAKISDDRFLVTVSQPDSFNGSKLAKDPLNVDYVYKTYLLNTNGSLGKSLPSAFPALPDLRFAELASGDFVFTWYDADDKEFYVQAFNKKFRSKAAESEASDSVKIWDTDIAKLQDDDGALQVMLQKTGKLYVAYIDKDGNIDAQPTLIVKIDRKANDLNAIGVPGSNDVLVTWERKGTIYGLRFTAPVN